jgi:hypothetical protein
MRRVIWPILCAFLLAAGCGGAAGDPDLEGVRADAELARLAAAPGGQIAVRRLLEVSRTASESWQATTPPKRTTRCLPGSESRLGSRSVAYAGVARHRVTAYRKPGVRAIRTFDRVNVNDYPMVFGVLAEVLGPDCRPAWYRVQLPIRPNGAEGYVRASALDVATVRTRIEIDLSDRRLEFFRDGKLVYRLTTAVGSKLTPTPTGRYYVNQRLLPGDPTGPWGPGALGISAFSPVLIHWEQGGPIAIHGTNTPSSIGKAVSNGCIRLANDDLVRLYERTPAGSPVVISA